MLVYVVFFIAILISAWLLYDNIQLKHGGADEKMLFVGDSFVNIFTLVSDPNVIVKKFKGATALGVSKKTNENRKHVEDSVKRYNPKCVVFNFGSVDVHFSYFYKLCQGPVDIDEFTSNIATSYIDFIKTVKASNIIVITPYYSPVKDEIVLFALKKYGIIDETCFDKIRPFINRKNRNTVVDSFNKKIKELCNNNTNIRVIDINPDISTDGILHPQFIDISQHNIHLLWDPLIKIYTRLLNDCGVRPERLKNLRKETARYLKYKKSRIADLPKGNSLIL